MSPGFKRGWRRAGAASALATLLVVSWGGLAAAETLKQALSGAYRYNPRLDAARATLRATDEEVARAHAGYRPSVTGSADTGILNTKSTPGSSVETHPKGYAVQAVQPLFRGFRTINNISLAEATVRAGRETLRSTEAAVLLASVTDYLDVVRDQALVRLRENNVAVLTRELKATQDRFKVGEVTRTDVAQAEASRATAVAALDLARANLKNSRSNYERDIGRPPSNLVEPVVPERLLPKTIGDVSSTASQEHPDLVSALYREQAARITVDLIWGELLPSAQLEATYSKRFEPSQAIDESESTSLIGRLSVPIYEGGEVRARVRQAKQTHVSRLQEVEQSRAAVNTNAVTAWANLQAIRARLNSDQVAVQANQVALNGVREEEKVGQRTLLDVLNAEQTLLNAQVSLVTDQHDLVIAAYTLLSAVGRLDAQTLALNSEVYDPEEHYFEVRRKWFGISITHRDGRHEFRDLWESHGRDVRLK